MSDRLLVTGAAGLVGSECCKLFSKKGYEVIGIDNYMRAQLFGDEASTRETMERLLKEYSIEHYDMDFRDERIIPLIKRANAVIHTAAQPSHPKSIEIPLEDFQINAFGTLCLLENVRKHNRDAAFVFCSTNKVYGDAPNYFSYKEVGKRFEPVAECLIDGFDETLRTDRCMHTPFGVSKLAADLYAQEYALLYGLKTGVFRMGCITGGAAKAVEMHNWEPYFIRKALTGETLTIYGYGGYQVRDVIHAGDLAELFYEFIKNPKAGEVYNVGGGRQNSISLLESFDLIEDVTGKKINYKLGQAREGDHIWWISNINKTMSHYPNWKIRIGLRDVFTEIYNVLCESMSKPLSLSSSCDR